MLVHSGLSKARLPEEDVADVASQPPAHALAPPLPATHMHTVAL